jgi:DsbC/DsbD-like thiol-disulfide interchange protein
MLDKILINTWLCCFLAAFLFSGCSPREPQLAPHPVQVSLISDHISASPGDIVSIGVLFEIEDPWHIYWKFPGEGGIPTSVMLNLPFDSSPLRLNWPRPQSFKQPGNLRGIGYKGSELLWYDILVPDDFEQPRFSFDVEALWLACAEICIPGRKKIKASLEIGKTEIGPRAPLFASARLRLPEVMVAQLHQGTAKLEPDSAAGNLGFVIEALGKGEYFDYRIGVLGATDPKSLEIFRAGNYDLKESRQLLEDGSKAITLWAREAEESETKEMELVFLYRDEKGDTKALALNLPGKEQKDEAQKSLL